MNPISIPPDSMGAFMCKVFANSLKGNGVSMVQPTNAAFIPFRSWLTNLMCNFPWSRSQPRWKWTCLLYHNALENRFRNTFRSSHLRNWKSLIAMTLLHSRGLHPSGGLYASLMNILKKEPLRLKAVLDKAWCYISLEQDLHKEGAKAHWEWIPHGNQPTQHGTS